MSRLVKFASSVGLIAKVGEAFSLQQPRRLDSGVSKNDCGAGSLESGPPGAAIMCDAVDSTGAAWSELGSNREEASAAAIQDCRERSPDPLTCVVSMCGFLEE